MNGFGRVCIIATIATFLGFFAVEAVFWTHPFVHGLLVPQLNPGLDFKLSEQAEILRAVFINQGVYNLMVAIGGIAGLVMASRADPGRGWLLIRFTCLFALGAALTLALTTQVYLLALVQAAFPLAALAVGRGSIG